MKKAFLSMVILFIMAAVGAPTHCFAEDRVKYAMSAKTKPDGQKWRIGYVEGGIWEDYSKTFKGTIESLMNDGWFTNINIPEPADNISPSAGTVPDRFVSQKAPQGFHLPPVSDSETAGLRP